ncbi:hypothetical protein Tco_0882116, partial [Tanacetum coccineum]
DLICKDKRKQKRAKTDKERKSQVIMRKEIKAGSTRYKKRKQMKAKGSIMTSFQSLRALLDVLKSKDQSCQN